MHPLAMSPAESEQTQRGLLRHLCRSPEARIGKMSAMKPPCQPHISTLLMGAILPFSMPRCLHSLPDASLRLQTDLASTTAAHFPPHVPVSLVPTVPAACLPPPGSGPCSLHLPYWLAHLSHCPCLLLASWIPTPTGGKALTASVRLPADPWIPVGGQSVHRDPNGLGSLSSEDQHAALLSTLET